jgi:hypothetical protein
MVEGMAGAIFNLDGALAGRGIVVYQRIISTNSLSSRGEEFSLGNPANGKDQINKK